MFNDALRMPWFCMMSLHALVLSEGGGNGGGGGGGRSGGGEGEEEEKFMYILWILYGDEPHHCTGLSACGLIDEPLSPLSVRPWRLGCLLYLRCL